MHPSRCHVPSRLFRVSAVCVAALLATAAGSTARGQFDAGVEQKLLLDLQRDGKYQQALSEARRLEKVLKPAKKGAAPGPDHKRYVELLIYRGTIERRIGSLEQADKTLTDAFKLFSDPAFQQMVAAGAPRSDRDRDAYWLQVELPYLQLLDNGTEVLLEKIRTANERRKVKLGSKDPGESSPRSAPATGEGEAKVADDEAAEREQIVKWFGLVDRLIRLSQQARSSLQGGFVEAGQRAKSDPVAMSPQARMMMSMSRPYRYVGMRYLEASRLPWTLSFDTDTVQDDDPKARARAAATKEPTDEPPEERRRQAASQRMRAAAYLQQSWDLAEAAMAPVFAELGIGRKQPAGDENLFAANEADGEVEERRPERPEDRSLRIVAEKEAARVRAERLVPMAEVKLLEGSLPAARQAIDVAIYGLRQAEVPNHPELARPLIVSAEVAFAESRAAGEKRDAVVARDRAKLAVESLREARGLLESADSEFDRSAPLHRLLADQLAVAESFEKSSSQSVAATSAAEAAARRALPSLKAPVRPKPQAPPPDATPQAPATPAAPASQPGKAAPPGTKPAPPAAPAKR